MTGDAELSATERFSKKDLGLLPDGLAVSGLGEHILAKLDGQTPWASSAKVKEQTLNLFAGKLRVAGTRQGSNQLELPPALQHQVQQQRERKRERQHKMSRKRAKHVLVDNLTGICSLVACFALNPRLVRGLNDDSHTAFEITNTHLGAQATVCGGGRQAGLVESLGGPATPAVGWALGLERLVLLLAQRQGAPATPPPPDLYVVNRGEAAEAWALACTRRWRLAGLAVELDLSGAAFGKQFKRADRSCAPWAVVIGDSEAAEGLVVLKELRGEAGEDRRLAPEAVREALAGRGA
jgi:histidyl-tRNA synthetase